MLVLHGLDFSFQMCERKKKKATKTCSLYCGFESQPWVITAVLWNIPGSCLPLWVTSLFLSSCSVHEQQLYCLPQILSQATLATQMKDRLNTIWSEGGIQSNCLSVPRHWIQNQVTGRAVTDRELVLWATKHTPRQLHGYPRFGFSDENVKRRCLWTFKRVHKSLYKNRNMFYYPGSHRHPWTCHGAACQPDTDGCHQCSHAQVVLYACVRETRGLWSWHPSVKQAEMMHDPEPL